MNHYTEQQHDHRFIGDVVIENENGNKYHGFENHQGITFLGEDEHPLGKVLQGYGNNGQDGTEGAVHKNTVGTYFHGPIMAVMVTSLNTCCSKLFKTNILIQTLLK